MKPRSKSSGRTRATASPRRKPARPAGVPAVSVVLPAYNSREFIVPNVERLRAFCRSRFPSFEIIVVDDGSTDRTLEAARKLSGPEVKVIGLDRNRGKYGALVAGMARARGRAGSSPTPTCPMTSRP
jgi:glycosyltransferase involved in cell wall biosynthesis